jgi:hypothetical protein
MRPALSVKVPSLQSSHERSLLAVARAVVYVPATQALLTASHVAVPPTAVNVMPTSQDVHVLSALAVPAA